MPVSINNTTLTFNDATTQTTSGVTSVSAGTGISVAGGKTPTITNTGVTSVTAGSGISVSASTGGVTISASGGGVTSYNGQTGAITNNTFNAIGSYTAGARAANSTSNPGDTIAGSSIYQYSTSPYGNVHTSNGTTWVSSAPSGGVTSLNGQTGAITNTGFNNIGSYTVGRGVAGVSYNVGTTVSGSSIAAIQNANTGPFASCQSDVGALVGSNQGQTGTWRAMAGSSAFTSEGTSFSSTTLWVRIS